MFAKFCFQAKLIKQFVFMSFEYFLRNQTISAKIPANIGNCFRKIFVMSAKILSKLLQNFACCVHRFHKHGFTPFCPYLLQFPRPVVYQYILKALGKNFIVHQWLEKIVCSSQDCKERIILPLVGEKPFKVSFYVCNQKLIFVLSFLCMYVGSCLKGMLRQTSFGARRAVKLRLARVGGKRAALRRRVRAARPNPLVIYSLLQFGTKSISGKKLHSGITDSHGY